MKSKIFIGSSVEGLAVAYAIQQNLLHDAETTVWDQGVFELSDTTIESLTKALSKADFGIFVFTPDDAVKIRNVDSRAVRDNVLFEFGLFIGKLGRERVFFIMPSGVDAHIPSDLVGIAPGRYETNRSDGSMQAATGPVCHQMRQKIKTLGRIDPDRTEPSQPEEVRHKEDSGDSWLVDFFEDRFDAAKEKIEEISGKEGGMEVSVASAWMGYCEYKQRKSQIEVFFDLSRSNLRDVEIQKYIGTFLRWEKCSDLALEILEALPEDIKTDPVIRIAIAECHVANEDHDKAIDFLTASPNSNVPSIAIQLAEIYEAEGNSEKALKCLLGSYKKYKNNELLRYKMARILADQNINDAALYLLDDLSMENSKSSDYFGYLGNCCVALNLHDQALQKYQRAELLASGAGSSWIINNIGNVYFAKGLPTEAIRSLETGVSLDKNSEYGHQRLAQSIKLRDEEAKIYAKRKREGLQKIRAMCLDGNLDVEPIIYGNQLVL